MAEVLDVSVSDLLGKKIEVSDEEKEIDVVASELAKLNELLVVYGNKISGLKKKIVTGITIVLMVIFIMEIYGSWSDMWYEFGQNLYHMFN